MYSYLYMMAKPIWLKNEKSGFQIYEFYEHRFSLGMLVNIWKLWFFFFFAVFTDIYMIILYLSWGTQHFTIYLICIPCKYYINYKTHLSAYTVALVENRLYYHSSRKQTLSLSFPWPEVQRIILKIFDSFNLCGHLAKFPHFFRYIQEMKAILFFRSRSAILLNCLKKKMQTLSMRIFYLKPLLLSRFLRVIRGASMVQHFPNLTGTVHLESL